MSPEDQKRQIGDAGQGMGLSGSFGGLGTPAANAQALHDAELRRRRELDALRSNLRESWAALRMIREAVETLGPVGAMASEEHVACAVAPTHMAEAEAIVAGIMRIADKPCRRCGSRSMLVFESIVAVPADKPCCWCDGTGFGPDREKCPHCEASAVTSTDQAKTKIADQAREQARFQGYTGDVCSQCGQFRMRQSGHCLVCDACGTTTGCS